MLSLIYETLSLTLIYETVKFIQTSDDLNIATYLWERTDENICLYRGYKFSNATFGEQDMTSFDLKGTCNRVDGDNEYCYNVLRFSDRENPSKIKDFFDKFTGRCFHF